MKNTIINTAVVYTDNIEPNCAEQILAMTNSPALEQIRIMPDCHAGKGSVIGFTAIPKDGKVIPNVIGVDIGCGMMTNCFTCDNLVLKQVDDFIRNYIPAGTGAVNPDSPFDKRNLELSLDKNISLKETFDINRENSNKIFDELLMVQTNPEKFLKEKKYIAQSVGSLGAGNHFIEIANDGNDYFLIIHTGSRKLGTMVAEHYQNLAQANFGKIDNDQFQETIKKMKADGVDGRIIGEFVKQHNDLNKTLLSDVPKDLQYLEGQLAKDYLHDMKLAQKYAVMNRDLIANIILGGIKQIHPELNVYEKFHTIHNYIDDANIIRKGAISAKKGELVLIPINMRDGSILARGKGNLDWNQSAPHGAGRILSRTAAKANISLNDFEDSMKDVYSSTISEDTLDEAPFAYKSLSEILSNSNDTFEVLKILKPIYNFKGEKNLPFVNIWNQTQENSKKTKMKI